MADHQHIVFGLASQSIYLDVPEGRPSSVSSVGVYQWDASDDSTALSATTGSASIDSVNTTFDAASGAGQSNPRTLNLTATTSLVIGRQYLATAANGEKEWVEIGAIVSGATAQANHPLQNAYASSDTLVGTRISITIDSTWVAQTGNLSDATDANPGYRVLWKYVVSGATYYRYTYFSLVRVAAGHNVRPADMVQRWPDWIDRLPKHHREDRGRRIIDDAFQELEIMLHSAGLPAEQARNQDLIDRLTMYRAEVIAAESANDELRLERASTNWAQMYNDLIKGPSEAKIPFSKETTGAGAYRQPVSITRR